MTVMKAQTWFMLVGLVMVQVATAQIRVLAISDSAGFTPGLPDVGSLAPVGLVGLTGINGITDIHSPTNSPGASTSSVNHHLKLLYSTKTLATIRTAPTKPEANAYNQNKTALSLR